jgi:hypothetical protein
MGQYDFNADLPLGQLGEGEAISLLSSIGYTFNDTNDTITHDLSMSRPNGDEVTFEIKTDVFCIAPSLPWLPVEDTGNIFLEYECRGKASGINATQADVFGYYYKNLRIPEMWFINMDELRDLVNNNDFMTTNDSGDEGSGTKGYLIPRRKHFESFTVYEKVDGKWRKRRNQN